MFPTITINNKSDQPAYRQIIEHIIALVKSNKLKPGDKVISEKELSEMTSVDIPTIKKSYAQLINDRVIEHSEGRGYFISADQNILKENRKDKAVRVIEKCINELEHLKFSYREIDTLFSLKLVEREEQLEKFTLAAIDCNPEALEIYEKQLGFFTKLSVIKILLDDIQADKSRNNTMKHYNAIITTEKHYSEVLGLLPDLKERIIKAHLSPDQKTILELASIKQNKKIAIICKSQKFADIVHTKLLELKIAKDCISIKLSTEPALDSIIKKSEVIILPPGYSLPRKNHLTSVVQNFTQKGGKFVHFDYQIQRESLLHIEERIRFLINK